MNRIYFININTFGATPIMKFIIHFLKDTFDLHLLETNIKSTYTYEKEARVSYIGTFENAAAFNRQSTYFKLFKYFKVVLYLLTKGVFFRRSIVYSNDFQVIAIVALFKNIFFASTRCKLVYHQFELIEEESLSGINKILYHLFVSQARQIDLCIVPELNRLKVLVELLGIDESLCFLLPNTNKGVESHSASESALLEQIHPGAKVIGHIGSVGPNHFIEQFLKAFQKLNDPDVFFVMVGKQDDALKSIIGKYDLKNFIQINELPHQQLSGIYKRLNLGLILYKGIDRNFEFCAPNKLYEYWANGVPVLAHELKGLSGVFRHPEEGKLINFEKEAEILEAAIAVMKTTNREELIELFEKQHNIDKYLLDLQERLISLKHV